MKFYLNLLDADSLKELNLSTSIKISSILNSEEPNIKELSSLLAVQKEIENIVYNKYPDLGLISIENKSLYNDIYLNKKNGVSIHLNKESIRVTNKNRDNSFSKPGIVYIVDTIKYLDKNSDSLSSKYDGEYYLAFTKIHDILDNILDKGITCEEKDLHESNYLGIRAKDKLVRFALDDPSIADVISLLNSVVDRIEI